jgi:ABC-type sugar transport system substrate-binding protein
MKLKTLRSIRFEPLFLTMVLALSVAACSKHETTLSSTCKRSYTVGFSHPVGQAQFVIALKKKLLAAARENGCVKVLVDNTQNNNLESQRAAVESWVTQRVDAIVVLPVDQNALDGLRKKAQDQGTKWLIYGAGTKTSDGSVGFDNVKSGDSVAKDALAWVHAKYPDGGVTAAVTTLKPLPAFSGRSDQPLEQFGKAGLKVVSQQDCASQACGLQIAEDALRQHPDLRVFIGFNDDAALGASRAFANAKINPDDVYIAGQDGTLEALDAVKSGGAYRASAAILLDDLAHSIVTNSIAAADGKGRIDHESAVELGTRNDPGRLDTLIAQYKE